ncbi:MAG: recombination protein O N-terminal domain-containing protein [Patescibacteria group bacterium]
MSTYYTSEAYILRSYPIGEADRMVIFYTKTWGRVDVIAKGIRHEKSKLRGHVILWAPVRITVTVGRDVWRLIDIEVMQGVDSSRPESFYAAQFCAFLLKLVTEREESLDLWRTVELLQQLNSYERLAALKIRTLLALGLCPDRTMLTQFFGKRAVQFIVGAGDAVFLADPVEVAHFEAAIERILAANHIRA